MCCIIAATDLNAFKTSDNINILGDIMRNSNTKIAMIIVMVFLVLFMLLTVINLVLNASQENGDTTTASANSTSTEVQIEASNPYDAYSTTIPTEISSKPILNNRKWFLWRT